MTGCPGGSDGEESTCNVGDLGSIPGLGRCPGEGNGYPLQYSCLENSMGRRAWRATALVGYTPQGHKESDPTEQITLYSTGNNIRYSVINCNRNMCVTESLLLYSIYCRNKNF